MISPLRQTISCRLFRPGHHASTEAHALCLELFQRQILGFAIVPLDLKFLAALVDTHALAVESYMSRLTVPAIEPLSDTNKLSLLCHSLQPYGLHSSAG